MTHLLSFVHYHHYQQVQWQPHRAKKRQAHFSGEAAHMQSDALHRRRRRSSPKRKLRRKPPAVEWKPIKEISKSCPASEKSEPTSSSSSSSSTATTSTWRVYGVEVHPDDLVLHSTVGNQTLQRNKSDHERGSHDLVSPSVVTPAVLAALYKRIMKFPPVTRISIQDADKDNFSASSIFSSSPHYERSNSSVSQNRHNHSFRTRSGIVSVNVVRRSLDARASKGTGRREDGPRFVYVLDVTVADSALLMSSNSSSSLLRLSHQPGRMERLPIEDRNLSDLFNPKDKSILPLSDAAVPPFSSSSKQPVVIVVGAGPAGLFCALQLARTGGLHPIVLERGQPVERRGRDIGALMHRQLMNGESNYVFGEGGAGTWSDGKLTTRIGRNSESVRSVLHTLVQYGAPDSILTEGAPHLGTDNLVKLLRNMRHDLRRMGGEIRFGHKVTNLIIEDQKVAGVSYVSQPAQERVSTNMSIPLTTLSTGSSKTNNTIISKKIMGEAVVLATGHSARDMYEQLHRIGVQLEAKGFAVGFRVEHPQRIINQIQYGTDWGKRVMTGKSNTDVLNLRYIESCEMTNRCDLPSTFWGKLPVPSYRLATNKAFDGKQDRGVYSFCMCPGGQIVPASTDPNEVCVNGMSFSRRDSEWANSALVVTVAPNDEALDPYRDEHGVLAGLAFQRDMERKASIMGGGNLTVPVQRLTDFVSRKLSKSLPKSSYRLGVKSSPCHEIYPESLTTALRCALTDHFDKTMPDFLCEEGLLHAVETRTSSPVRVSRDNYTKQAVGIENLFPTGEGAGFAGGIVSSAVDGLVVAAAVSKCLLQNVSTMPIQINKYSS